MVPAKYCAAPDFAKQISLFVDYFARKRPLIRPCRQMLVGSGTVSLAALSMGSGFAFAARLLPARAALVRPHVLPRRTAFTRTRSPARPAGCGSIRSCVISPRYISDAV